LTNAHTKIAYQKLLRTLARFGGDTRGNIALIFGLSSVMIFTAVGAGLDLSRAYLARQKLSQVATLACQYASRPAIVETSTASYNGSGGGAAYSSQVTSFITTAWQNQNISLTQTNGTPFTYTQNGPANVTLAASVPTTFMQIAGFTAIPLQVQVHCYDTPGSVAQRVADSNSQIVMQESFENAPNPMPYGWTTYLPNGSSGTQSSSTGYTSAVGYTGANGTQWHVEGYCLEQDHAGNVKSTVYDGSYSVELDCDNGNSGNDKGNSSISTLVYLPGGAYELRYAYSSRVDYPSYDPAYLCGSSATDLNWANSSTTSWSGSMASAYRTNQINVYLDLNPSNNQPPQHTTLDGTQQLAGSNLIDMCLYTMNWVQRSVSINVTTAGYYWLSFAADGTNDSYGGQLDNIVLCRISCSGSVQDNFPSAWTGATLLFEDTFESITTSWKNSQFGDADITTSTGTSAGWPSAPSSGWSVEPVNEVNTIYYQPTQGTTAIELAADGGWGGVSSPSRTITREFLLDPGYYKVSYDYRSDGNFSTFGSTVYCGATPSLANINGLSGSGDLWVYGGDYGNGQSYSSNIVGVFMSHDQMASNPKAGSYGSTSTYVNPDGTTTSSPKVPDDNISLASYNSSQVNPLLDICGYASAWQTRTAYISIQKPAYYWLTFSALGPNTFIGGEIDDVKLTAVGSPYMSSPPSNAVTIPVPSPQPGSSISYTGFTITADPLAP
jgi:Flp pilus assembly protein TadG